MPVDWFVLILPVLFVVFLACSFAATRRYRLVCVIAAILCVAIFVVAYIIAPGLTWMPSAKGGDARAQYYYGQWFTERLAGLSPDVSRRDYWWLKSAEGGYPRAMVEVGRLHVWSSNGTFLRDLDEAEMWYMRAKESGYEVEWYLNELAEQRQIDQADEVQ